jgi:hypothetical protein
MTTAFTVRYMAGSCASGRGRRAVKWHAVAEPVGNGCQPEALCGRRPAIQWSDEDPAKPVTCPTCAKRLAAGSFERGPVLGRVTPAEHAALIAAETIAYIALKHLHVATLETRRSDRLDFHDCSVWGIKAALEAAFAAGAEQSRR